MGDLRQLSATEISRACTLQFALEVSAERTETSCPNDRKLRLKPDKFRLLLFRSLVAFPCKIRSLKRIRQTVIHLPLAFHTAFGIEVFGQFVSSFTDADDMVGWVGIRARLLA